MKKIRVLFNRGIFHAISCLLICALLKPQVASSLSRFDWESSQQNVVEYLRLHVAKENRNAWVEAEKLSWEPWLNKQDGFVGRQLLWDSNKEEAVLLIRWENRKKWKSIPQEDIDSVQGLFEKLAKGLTGSELRNPFPLISEGELLPYDL